MLLLDHIQFGYGFKTIGSLKGSLTLSNEGSDSRITLINGKNGSGKSTFLRTVAGLLPLQRGRILWRGEPLEEVQSEGKICYLGDRLEFCDALSVRSLLDLFVGSHQENRQLEKIFSLNGKLSWNRLSTGQKQKVRLCMVLRRMEQAELILMDEPFSGLDLESRQIAMDCLQYRLRYQEKRLLICLHQDYFPPGWIQNTLFFSDGTMKIVSDLGVAQHSH